MKLHLVGGFLGSGKTTAIISAAKQLMAQRKTVGVVTNDQGKYLVDTAFFRLNDVPTVEVTGGCFCCSYSAFSRRLELLLESMRPDAVFAEAIGSSGDLVASVINPLRRFKKDILQVASFSTFSDSRLLQARLCGEELPFSDSVLYMIDRQIEQAPVLVINKIDLLRPSEAGELRRLAAERYPGKTLLLQNSLDAGSVSGWLDRLESGEALDLGQPLDLDSQRFTDADARLAWLDMGIDLAGSGRDTSGTVRLFLSNVMSGLRQESAPVGHLKLVISGDRAAAKVSITSGEPDGWQAQIPERIGVRASVLLNARVQIEAQRLETLVRQALEQAALQSGCTVTLGESEAFQPAFPGPEHRLS